MSTLADDLGTEYFQLSTVGVGALAVGLEDIRQCIDIILRNIPGTDPLRPLFGCNAYKWMDASRSPSVPNIKKEIFEALSIWETRILVNSITHEFRGDAQVLFGINYTVIDDDLLDSITFSLNGGVTSSSPSTGAIIISAIIPPKVTNGVYRVSFITDGNPVYPAIPDSGFASAAAMLSWVSANWFTYGKWYANATSLFLYMNAGLASTVSLIVTEIVQITDTVLIPTLADGTYFNVNLVLNGSAAAPAFPTGTINTVDQLLSWVSNNWGGFGLWSVVSGNADTNTPGDFDNDFNNDFNTGGGITETRYLVFQTEAYDTATLAFI